MKRLAVATVIILTGCSQPMPTPDPPSGSPSAASDATGVAVWIELAYDPAAEGAYVEGAIPFVEITGVVETRQVEHGDLLHLPGGAHTLGAHVRPCSGNCASLDPATDACSAELDAQEGDEITVTLLLSPGQPCEIGIRPGPSADVVGVLQLSRYDGAAMPYEVGGRCVLIDSFYVPVFPDGWSLRSEGDEPLELHDPSNRRVAVEGELIWLDGDVADEQMPFGCDLGVRFDVTAVMQVDPFASTR